MGRKRKEKIAGWAVNGPVTGEFFSPRYRDPDVTGLHPGVARFAFSTPSRGRERAPSAAAYRLALALAPVSASLILKWPVASEDLEGESGTEKIETTR